MTTNYPLAPKPKPDKRRAPWYLWGILALSALADVMVATGEGAAHNPLFLGALGCGVFAVAALLFLWPVRRAAIVFALVSAVSAAAGVFTEAFTAGQHLMIVPSMILVSAGLLSAAASSLLVVKPAPAPVPTARRGQDLDGQA